MKAREQKIAIFRCHCGAAIKVVYRGHKRVIRTTRHVYVRQS